MSHHLSDPAQNPQFRRNWDEDDARLPIKFLTELSEQDTDRLAIAQGERIVRRLPDALVTGLNFDERRDLARAFGRPWLRRLREQRRL
jgi:hypothetical protein